MPHGRPALLLLVALTLAPKGAQARPARRPAPPREALPARWTAREKQVASALSPRTIAAHVGFLADDLTEGRAPGSRGDEIAIRYVAAELERLGIEPGGDERSYYQRFDLIALRSELTSPPTLRARDGRTLAWKPPADAILAPGVQKGEAAIAGAEVVFVGYGIAAPEQKWDDFKDTDVRGKVLLFMNNDPENDPSLFAGKTRLYYGRWDYKYAEAARRGAAGAIIIHTTPSAGYPWQVVQTSWGGEQFELPAGDEPRLQMKMWITDENARALAKLGGRDLDELRTQAESRAFRPVPLGVTFSAAMSVARRRLQTANVLGLLRGSDPDLSSQAVVLSAHHDHLGIGEVKNGDGIYNGALDNASGVADLLAIAEGLSRAQPRPRRSILFLALAAEESGLLGSEYYCHQPSFSPGQLAADINIDGINIWGRARDVISIGLGKTTLDELVQKAAGEQRRTVKPDQFPDRGAFYRSDQFNFAKIGVPSLYLKGGLDHQGHDIAWGRARVEEFERTRYHQPSDQIDATWNLDGALDDARLMAVLALRIADSKILPGWTEGDEFDGARRRALLPPTRTPERPGIAR